MYNILTFHVDYTQLINQYMWCIGSNYKLKGLGILRNANACSMFIREFILVFFFLWYSIFMKNNVYKHSKNQSCILLNNGISEPLLIIWNWPLAEESNCNEDGAVMSWPMSTKAHYHRIIILCPFIKWMRWLMIIVVFHWIMLAFVDTEKKTSTNCQLANLNCMLSVDQLIFPCYSIEWYIVAAFSIRK